MSLKIKEETKVPLCEALTITASFSPEQSEDLARKSELKMKLRNYKELNLWQRRQ